jgi:phage terminase large subunit
VKSENPLVFIVAGLTVPITKKNLIKPYKQIAGSYWNKDSFNKQEATLTYPNGSVVYFMSHGEHNAEDKFTGIEADYALFDELNLSPEADGVLRQVGMRLLSGSIIITQNPTRRKQWITELLENPKTKYIHSTYKDNLENLPDELIEEIEYRGSKNARFRAVYLEGRYMANAELAAFPKFNIVNTWPSNEKWSSWGSDYGFTDPTTLSNVKFYNGELWIRGYGYGSGLSTQQIADMYQAVPQRQVIIADSSAPRLIEELDGMSKCTVLGIKKYPGHKEEAVHSMNDYVINVYYDDPNLVREFEDLEWLTKNGESIDKLQDGNDHYTDSVIYACRDKLKRNVGKYSFI